MQLVSGKTTARVFVGAGVITLAMLTLYTASAHEDGSIHPHATARVQVEAEAGVTTERPMLRQRLEEVRANFDAKQEERVEARENLRTDLETRRENYEQRLNERKEELMQKREDMQKRFDERKGDIKERVSAHMMAFVEKVEVRFMAAIERLESIADRIGSRAEKFEAAGADVTATEEALVEAHADLDAAKILVADLSVKAEAAIAGNASSSPQTAFASIRVAIGEVKEVLKSVHTHLRTAVMNLKANAKVEAEAEVQSGNDNTESAE